MQRDIIRFLVLKGSEEITGTGLSDLADAIKGVGVLPDKVSRASSGFIVQMIRKFISERRPGKQGLAA